MFLETRPTLVFYPDPNFFLQYSSAVTLTHNLEIET